MHDVRSGLDTGLDEFPNPNVVSLRTPTMTATLLIDVRPGALLTLGAYGGRMKSPRRLTPVRARPVEAELDNSATLMQQVQQGDREAFSKLYDELAGLVHGVVLRVVRDPSISEEVTQEIFVELWRTALKFDDSRGNVRTWVATIAHRRAVDRVRSVEAARRRDQAETDERPVSNDGVDGTVISGMESQRVRKALDVLSDHQRTAIEMAYFDGLSYREVAVELGVPEGTIKTRIRDGMTRLRIELKEET